MKSKLFSFLFVAIMLASCSSSSRVASNSAHPQSDKEYWYNAHFNEASDYYNHKKWRKAEKSFRKAAEYKKDFAVNYNIALSAYQRDNYQDAITYFNLSLNYKHSQAQEDKAKSMIEKCRVARQKQIERRQAIGRAIATAVVATAAVAATAAVQSNAGAYSNNHVASSSSRTGNSSSYSSSSSHSHSYSSTSDNTSNASKRKCGFCGGRGFNVEYVAGYGLAKSEYCSTCGKEMMNNHAHITCHRCGGTGYEK